MPTNHFKDDYRHASVRLNPNLAASNPASVQYPPTPPKPNPRFLSLLLQAIIMVLIISIFLLFLGVAALALIHIFVAGRALHSHRIRRRASEFSDTAIPSHLVDNLQRFLPRLKYAAVFNEATKDCAVCLESFEEGEWCRTLPVCNHMFHENCVDHWLIKVPICPICRTRVQLNSGPSSSQISDDCKLLWTVGV